MANSRIPVSPLEYSVDNLGKAIPGELLVDYNKGKIYVKSKKAPYEIIDITNSVLSVVEDMNGENLKINRENVGLIEVDEEAKLIGYSSVQLSLQQPPCTMFKYKFLNMLK